MKSASKGRASVALAFFAICTTGTARGAGADGPPVVFEPPPRAPQAMAPQPAGNGTNARSWMRACSLRVPACVAAPPGTAPSAVLAALDAIERAWEVTTGAMALPAPDGDDRGAWTAYLVDPEADARANMPDGGAARAAWRDPRGGFDRVASYGVVDRALALSRGCALDLAAATAVAWGALLRAVPATDDGSALAETHMLARLATPCAGPGPDEAAFEADPERAILDASDPSAAAGAAMFFEWIDSTFGARPGALISGAWALAPTVTAPGASRWAARPTVFDVFRASLAGALGTDSDLDDVFLHFAIDRAFMFPAPRLAWHLPWPDHARRLASPVAVAPTGASYVMIDHAGAPPGASLRIEAQWEDYGRMRWAVVKVDAAGRPAAVLPVATQRLATQAAITVELLDGVDHLLVIGVDVGSTEHPFDPDQGTWEPHGWLLTVQPG